VNKKDVLAYFGTQARVGEVLNISQAAVSKWPDLVPEKQALKLSHITNGRLVYDPSLYRERENIAHTVEVSSEYAA